jgi:ABC-type branched-subunit amino acid transport system ATPase component
LLFAAISTRPNIAFAISRLAKFLNNSSLAHYKAADRALIYLYNTRQLFLRFGGQDNLVVASDASFADNSTDRKSSQAYAIKLFSGLISWRANKQNTVTTSITEAKLLALAQAAKESIYVSKLLQNLIIDFND